MRNTPLTHNEFLERVNTKFPDYFNHVELLEKYIDSKTHFKVKDKFGICNIQPSAILKGRYPTILSAVNKSEYFKNKIQYKHNTDLDFSLMKYENANSNLKMICPIHGIFEIGVEALLKNGKCTKCIRTQRSNEKRLSQEEFIKKANQIHNNKYDYSKTEYTIRLNKIIVTCPIHGDFKILSRIHLQGSGCKECGKNRRNNIIRSKSYCGSDYSFTNWVNKSKMSKAFEGFKLYVIECWDDQERFFKIGRTFNSMEKRINKRTLPYNYKIIKLLSSEDGIRICKLEAILHKQYSRYKIIPLLLFGGSTECFSELPNLQIARNFEIN